MGDRSLRGIAGVAVVVCLALLGAGPAAAGDPNHRPPDIELTAVGREGFIGTKARTLAYFNTGLSLDPKSEYRRDSKVTIKCWIDGDPASCRYRFEPILRVQPVYERPKDRAAQTGIFSGSVPLPDDLAPGPHTVTVRARDEDGPEAAAKSVTVVYDPAPPSAPALTEKPPRRSWEHQPEFHYTASDDLRLVRPERTFVAWLNRLAPTKEDYGEQDGVTAMSTWLPECPTLLTCSTRSQAIYFAEEDWYSFGEAEWLVPGLYEFSARARDAAGNRSPLTTYRFRILRGKPR
jgi:hypothetical protein